MIKPLIMFVLTSTAVTAYATEEPKVLGWTKNGNLGANLSLSSSQDVVGQTDGTSQTYGATLKTGLNRNTDHSEWRNDLSILAATTKTPTVPRFIKSADELKISSIYLYSLENYPNIGPYARAEAAAPMFKGEDVRSTPKSYRYLDKNSLVTESSVRLTDGFKPLTTKQSAGFFYKPVKQDRLKVETRIGVAGQQIEADGQYAVKGVNSAGEIELNRLKNISQAGLELALEVKGRINENSTYQFGAEVMTPLINNKDSNDDRDAIRLSNVDAFFKLASNMTNWASFGYDYKLKIQPQLVDRTQQIHMFVVTLNHNLF